MAFYTLNATVTTAALPLVTLPTTAGQGRAVQIQNLDSASIFVGGPNVTTSGATKGHAVLANQGYQVWISGGDTIYAISVAGTAVGAVNVQYSA